MPLQNPHLPAFHPSPRCKPPQSKSASHTLAPAAPNKSQRTPSTGARDSACGWLGDGCSTQENPVRSTVAPGNARHLLPQSVKRCSPNPNSLPLREFSRHPRLTLHESDSSKSISCATGHCHTQLPQGGLRLWHHSFAARLINGRLHSVCHGHRKTFSPRRNRRCQPGRASSDYKNVRLRFSPVHQFHLSWTTLSMSRMPVVSGLSNVHSAAR